MSDVALSKQNKINIGKEEWRSRPAYIVFISQRDSNNPSVMLTGWLLNLGQL